MKLNRKQNNYTQLRRNAMMAMGFCSGCSNFNDRFPDLHCSNCKYIAKKAHLRREALRDETR